MSTTALASRSGSNPVGVRNCDHPLDLRIRSERRRRASASLDAPGSEPPSFDSLALEAKCLDRLRSRSAQDLSTSDSDLIPLGCDVPLHLSLHPEGAGRDHGPFIRAPRPTTETSDRSFLRRSRTDATCPSSSGVGFRQELAPGGRYPGLTLLLTRFASQVSLDRFYHRLVVGKEARIGPAYFVALASPGSDHLTRPPSRA